MPTSGSAAARRRICSPANRLAPRRPPRHRAGDVRGDEDVGRLPQGVIRGERLRVGYVKRGADAAGTQRLQERIGIDGLAAARIDEQSAWLHASEKGRVDAAIRLR